MVDEEEQEEPKIQVEKINKKEKPQKKQLEQKQREEEKKKPTKVKKNTAVKNTAVKKSAINKKSPIKNKQEEEKEKESSQNEENNPPHKKEEPKKKQSKPKRPEDILEWDEMKSIIESSVESINKVRNAKYKNDVKEFAKFFIEQITDPHTHLQLDQEKGKELQEEIQQIKSEKEKWIEMEKSFHFDPSSQSNQQVLSNNEVIKMMNNNDRKIQSNINSVLSSKNSSQSIIYNKRINEGMDLTNIENTLNMLEKFDSLAKANYKFIASQIHQKTMSDLGVNTNVNLLKKK